MVPPDWAAVLFYLGVTAGKWARQWLLPARRRLRLPAGAGRSASAQGGRIKWRDATSFMEPRSPRAWCNPSPTVTPQLRDGLRAAAEPWLSTPPAPAGRAQEGEAGDGGPDGRDLRVLLSGHEGLSHTKETRL